MNPESHHARPLPAAGPQATPAASCCAPAQQSTCCAAEDKPTCCGAEATASGGCGCR